MAQTSWGGARKGAGRKPAKPGEERKVRTFRLNDMEYALAKSIHREIKKKKTFVVAFGPNYPNGAIGRYKNESEVVPLEQLKPQNSPVSVVDESRSSKKVETMNAGQLQAFEAMQSGQDCFLTGGAGTGKSYVLQKFISWAEGAGKQVLVCASTGIAAQHIGGVTVHHAFRVPIGIITPALLNPKDIDVHLGKQKKVIAATDIVVIDEVSMLRADVFDYVMGIIKHEEVPHMVYDKALKKKKKVQHHIQVIICGDFAQLPPVIGSRDREIWNKYYPGNKSGFAFGSSSWKFVCYGLSEVVRQEDAQFAGALNDIRLSKASGLTFINEHRARKRIANAIDLCATNSEAEQINSTAVAALHTHGKMYYIETEGQVSKSDITLPRELYLKVGCRVILCSNNADKGYFNGQFATVTELQDDKIVVQLEDSRKVEIERKTISIENYVEDVDEKTGKKTLRKVEIGRFNQLPVKIGYAVTIHRSQGQTYDAVNLHISKIFASGQLYVALSRCRSIESTYFYRPIQPDALFVDDEVLNFYNRM